ncbi:MAG TPA: GNAT family N-acetyltransferase [Clostridiaceae bacterium]|nr:GNAT family N-acetyltransferase [Clostridiaceae bacterium]
MEFRIATISDINRIMDIIRQAQEYLRNKGVDQWQDNYPNLNIIRDDIEKRKGYVLEKDGQVVATVAISFSDEKTYEKIYEGKWITENEYAVIHRIAVDNNFKGKRLSSEIIAQVEKMCLQSDIYSIKVDTHKQNESMKKMLSNNGFQYCGIIFLEDGSERVAYEKVI